MNFSKIVILLRGASGSGKSAVAEFIANTYKNDNFAICSADDFLIKDGQQNFDAQKLGLAHNYCYEKFERSLSYCDLIILSNTNTRNSEIIPYLDLAAKHGYTVFSLVVENLHGNKNLHGVPEKTLLAQAERLKNSIKLI